MTFRNIINNGIREIEHKGEKDHNDFKTKDINKNEYFINFHIKIVDFEGFVSALEFSKIKIIKLYLGEKGASKIIKSNKGENIILGTSGYYGDQIDSIGFFLY